MVDLPETVRGLELYINYAKKESLACDKRKKMLEQQIKDCEAKLLLKKGMKNE